MEQTGNHQAGKAVIERDDVACCGVGDGLPCMDTWARACVSCRDPEPSAVAGKAAPSHLRLVEFSLSGLGLPVPACAERLLEGVA